MLPPPLQIFIKNRQNRNPHKPPAQPCHSPRCWSHHSCCTHQRHLTLQIPMACPGQGTHTLTGLCALWLPSAASFSGNQSSQSGKTTTPTNHLPSPAAAPISSSTIPAEHCRNCIYLAVLPGIPRAGHPHTGRALCSVVAKCCLLLWKSPQTRKTTTPTNYLSSPATATNAGSTTPAEHCRGCI